MKYNLKIYKNFNHTTPTFFFTFWTKFFYGPPTARPYLVSKKNLIDNWMLGGSTSNFKKRQPHFPLNKNLTNLKYFIIVRWIKLEVMDQSHHVLKHQAIVVCGTGFTLTSGTWVSPLTARLELQAAFKISFYPICRSQK